MTKEHKLRLACRGLKGQERTDTMMALCLDPSKIDQVLGDRLNYYWRTGRRKARPSKTKKDVNISIRLTYAEYAELKRRAKSYDSTVSKLVVRCCLLSDT